MFISHLSLTNFRNYLYLELDLPPFALILLGGNAQGKSNLLEAVYLLSTTRSPRAGAERELISWEAQHQAKPFARLAAEVKRVRDSLRLEMRLEASPESADSGEAGVGGGGGPWPAATPASAFPVQKRFKINGLPRRTLDTVGQVTVSLFSAQDVELIGGPPSLKRRHLDAVLSQVDSLYLRHLQRYQKVLLQRNSLLRLISEDRARPEELAFWNEELATAGAYLMVERQRLVQALNPVLHTLHQGLSGHEALGMSYLPCLGEPHTQSLPPELAQAETRLRQALERLRDKEVAQGASLVGPHRDDLGFTINGIDMGLYGSRGQKRTIVLSLRLAEGRYLWERRGDAPILLLDDVLSELDEARRRRLLDTVRSYQQVFITATDLDRFPASFLNQAAVFEVAQGRVTRLTEKAD